MSDFEFEGEKYKKASNHQEEWGLKLIKEVKVWGENADRYFDDQEQMIRWIEQPAIVPFLSHLSENKYKKFKEIVIDNMIKRTKEEDGRCFETFRRINVLAKKA